MSSTNGTKTPQKTDNAKSKKNRTLKTAVDAVRTRQADQRDVVVDLGEAEKARLDLLAFELLPLFEEIDDSDDRFELGVSRGDRPRMWIDMTTFVAMGHDKLSYRLLKDTRMGRIVMAETDDLQKMADFVSDYVAEKVVEREKMIEGEWRSMMSVKNAAVELSRNAAADAATDATADATADAASDGASDATIDAGTDASTDATADTADDAKADIANDAKADIADDAKADTAADGAQSAPIKTKRRSRAGGLLLMTICVLAVIGALGFFMVPQAI